MGLLQREVADQIGVDVTTIRNWELGHAEPAIRHFPALIRFLGYVPLRRPVLLAEELRVYRKLKGVSRERFARQLGVDPATVWRWESGNRVPGRRLRKRIEAAIRSVLSSSRWG